MISYIRGRLAEVLEDTIVLENNGMGYNIRVPGSVLAQMPPEGEEVKVFTYLYVREDAINLFGFLSREDLDIFRLLLNVSGIGPKGALAILSTISPEDLRFAVFAGDAKLIATAPGIGNKTAQRLIIELKDKLKLEEAPELGAGHGDGQEQGSSAKNEAVAALVSLGYGSSDAMKAVRMVEQRDEMDTEAILKAALKNLAIL